MAIVVILLKWLLKSASDHYSGLWLWDFGFSKQMWDMGVSINGGTPNGWFMMENPFRMDDLGGTPFLHMLWDIYMYIYIILYPHDIPVTSPVKVNINHHKSRYFGLGGLANKCTYKNWCSQRYVGLALCCPSSRRSLDHPLGGFNMSQLSRQPLDECGKPNVIKHPQVITMESPKCVYWIAFGKPRRP